MYDLGSGYIIKESCMLEYHDGFIVDEDSMTIYGSPDAIIKLMTHLGAYDLALDKLKTRLHSRIDAKFALDILPDRYYNKLTRLMNHRHDKLSRFQDKLEFQNRLK